ncbi:MAG: MFS transporter [Bacteroidetes bacterium]|nr:MFS transporter [Bacteroidota bacterium]
MHTVNRHPWFWVPSLYFAEGFPYVIVMTVSGIYYKTIGVSNTDIALYTSLFSIPWMVKPLWSPYVDIVSQKRGWILWMQGLIALALLMVAVGAFADARIGVTLFTFFLIAFFSATHDIAADGFYMLALTEKHQSAFVGVRNLFYRLALITGQGLLIVVAGSLEHFFPLSRAWALVFFISALLLTLLTTYHAAILPSPPGDVPSSDKRGRLSQEFIRSFIEFFSKKDIFLIVAFLFFYRFAEALLVKVVPLFLLDPFENGGLGLSTQQVGIVYGTVGVLALVLGGLLGGYCISRHGLRAWLWPMTVMMHVPDLVYVYLSFVQPSNITLISIAIAFEQFGYGFGFTAYTMYMIYISEGHFKTSHYALCTGFMALSMIVPGMISGALQETVGYPLFFLLVLAATLPAFAVVALVNIPKKFGSNKEYV